MASLIIRNLEERVKEELRVRAARNGQSMEAEARQILRTALTAPAPTSGRTLAERIHDRFAELGGVELELAPRAAERDPPDFSAC